MSDEAKNIESDGGIERAFAQGVRHVEQYAGVWMMHEQSAENLRAHVGMLDLPLHVRAARIEAVQIGRAGGDDRDPAKYRVENGIAHIDMIGTFTKYGSSFSDNPGTDALKTAFTNAANDSRVDGIFSKVFSPGGSSFGVDDLAQAIGYAATQKPVVAFGEDMVASAAIYAASQATKFVATRSTLVGSIGTYMVLQDLTRMAEKQGVKVIVVKAGAMKAVGVPGTEITAEQIAEVQREVNAINDLFVAAVARGRGMSEKQARGLADGRIHQGDFARALGLIDAVMSQGEAIGMLMDMINKIDRTPVARGARQPVNHVNPVPSKNQTSANVAALTNNKGGSSMNNDGQGAAAGQAETKPKAATVAELKTEFPGSSAEFRERCIEADMTLDQARKAWTAELSRKLEASEKSAKAEKERADEAEKKLATKRPGGAGVGTRNASTAGGEDDAEFTGNARQEIEKLVSERMKMHGEKRHEAWAQVMRDRPELGRALDAEANAKR